MDIEKYDEYKAWYEDYENKRLDYVPHITELAYATRIINLRTSPIFRPVPLTVIRFGDVVLTGFGGEAFTAYGQMTRDLAPDKFVVCAVCANGYEGYLPTEKAERHGHYSAFISSGQVGHVGGEQLVRQTLQNIREMFAE